MHEAAKSAKQRSRSDEIFYERPVTAREATEAKEWGAGQAEPYLRVRFAAPTEPSRPSPIWKAGGTGTDAGLISGVAVTRRVPQMPTNLDCLRPGNGDREFGHVGCEVDEFGVGGLTDVAAKEGGDGLGDMSPSSDVPGWGSDASAAERFTVEVCRQLLEFLGYWGTL